jgi:sulfite dehydrogenase (cytochrome) subunit B
MTGATTGHLVLAAALLVALPLAARAQTRSIVLPPDHPYGDLRAGPGADVTERACRACHSTDYVVMQPPGDARQWEGVVTKMIKVYGASISAEDAHTIARYLTTHYGK